MSTSEPRHAVLCRYGEIFLKGQNRSFFERKLEGNLKRAVHRIGGRVERLHGRYLVWPNARAGEGQGEPAQLAVERMIAALQRVFGLSSISPVLVVDKSYEAIEAAARASMIAALQHGRPRSFKVESRRADKRFPMASIELSQRVGGTLFQELKVLVDVHDPELVVGIEVGFEYAFTFARTIAAPGGLPVGCTGKADLLLSGGIDSPVAGWMAMKRGCEIAATYFHSFPYTGDKTKDKVRRLGRKLAAWQGPIDLRVVPFTEAQKALRNAGTADLAVVLYRRMMMRVASAIAEKRGAIALVTGEALAQVASQTLENMTVIGEASRLLVLRPLVAHDKQETVAWAKKIDTFELSIEPYEDCCSLWVPEHPTTRASRDKVAEAEGQVDIAALAQACVEGTETIACEP